MRTLIPVLSLLLAACGAPASPPTAPPPETSAPAPARWDARIAELLPVIDACLALAPTNRTVTYAAPDLVRLDGEGGKLDCRIDASGAAQISPADAALSLEGDGAALFVRGPGENPGGECYEAPEVRGPDGALLGWMLDPDGC